MVKEVAPGLAALPLPAMIVQLRGDCQNGSSPEGEVALPMNLISRFVIIPMSFGALATGLLQALGTPWGLFRYYWIVTKFGLAIFATFALLVHQFAVMAVAAKRVSGAAAETLFSADFGPVKPNLCVLPVYPYCCCSLSRHWECLSPGA